MKSKQDLSLFGVLKDENRPKECEKNQHRADKLLEDTNAVCELHLQPRLCILSMEKKCAYLTHYPRRGCFQLVRLTNFCDRGGLLHPSSQLYSFMKKLEDIFTECFCQSKLHSDSIMDILAIVQRRLSIEVGCSVHAATLKAKVITFYVVTRLHSI